VDETRQRLDKLLLVRTDYDNHWQAFNVAKSVCRFSFGLSKRDETSRLIDRFLERIQATSSSGFFDDVTPGLGGAFTIYGPMSFVFIRQSLQLHANANLRERKLPSLRTAAEKYLRLVPDLVRADGCGWVYGRSTGAYGQMHLISLLMQAFRDGWITPDQRVKYLDLLRRLFFFFFSTYLDQEHGYVVVRDAERSAIPNHTTRMANFDAARYLCQWARLARSIDEGPEVRPEAPKTTARWVIFDKGGRKEQGAFFYRDAVSGLCTQLPLCSSGGYMTAPALPFPQCPGVFDAPVNIYLPVLVPELTFGGKVTVPAFYGKNCTAGLGLRNAFYFRYDQPDLVTKDEEWLNGLGSCRVQWTFLGSKITSEFTYTVKSQVTLDRFRYCLVIGAPHTQYRTPQSPALGAGGLRCEVLKDDFQASWQETEDVTGDEKFRTHYGRVHFLQTLLRDHPLVMRPGQAYTLKVAFDPDIVAAG
jgi:hypothetical protein